MFTVLVSCDKEIEFDYNDIKPVYVVNGKITNYGIDFLITKTVNVTDSVSVNGLEVDYVKISGSNGYQENLQMSSNGHYFSPTLSCGVPGVEYTAEIRTKEGDIFTSTETMVEQCVLDSAIYLTIEMPMITLYGYDFYVANFPGQLGYFEFRYYVNNVFAGNGMMSYTSNENFFNCPYIMQSSETDYDNENKVNYRDGDTLSFVCRSFSKSIYDYKTAQEDELYNMSNAPTNWTGGCIGVFEVYTESRGTALAGENYIR